MDKNKQQFSNSGLYLISTPIGNLGDITLRAINILKNSDLILCEDTRRSGKLLHYLKIKKKLIPYHKFNEKKVSKKIIEFIEKNKLVSLISDAGTPTISDPGLILINKCIENGVKIYPIPGPSAVTTALSVSGFNEKFLFYGFLGKKENELNNILKKLTNLNFSIVFFIPASKINYYISKFKNFFSDRKILIAREMTKIHEDFIRDKVILIKNMPENLKGELTVVLSEKIVEKNIKKEVDESVKVQIAKMLKKYTLKDVVEYISKKESLSKKIVYDLSLRMKKE